MVCLSSIKIIVYAYLFRSDIMPDTKPLRCPLIGGKDCVMCDCAFWQNGACNVKRSLDRIAGVL